MRGLHADHMQTTLTIDDALLAAAKSEAKRSGRTLDAVVEEALREALSREADRPPTRVGLPTFSGGRLLPGVNLDSNAALLEIMEEERDRRIVEGESPS